MPTHPLNPGLLSIVTTAALLSCAPSTQRQIPPVPMRGFWPEPAFEPAIQCHGGFSPETLQDLLPRARLALQVPGTSAVNPDPTSGCLRITVEDIETGRFTALLLRGVGIPRSAVLLQLATPEPSGAPQSRSGRGA
jgi:hypothetical protein